MRSTSRNRRADINEAEVAHGLNATSGRLRFLIAFLVSFASAAPLQSQSRDYSVSDCQDYCERELVRIEPNSPVNLAFASYSLTTSRDSLADQIGEALRSAPSAAGIASCNSSTRLPDCFIFSTSSTRSVADERAPFLDSDHPSEGSKAREVSAGHPKPVHSNEFFYKNRLEFSVEGGWLPINIPFVFDVFLGDGYTMTNLKYTLAPIIASVRWQTGNPDGPWIFRGNWDLEASGAAVVIPRGPETRYFTFILGFRRNFVPRSGRIAPYFDGRLGMGEINAKAPLGVLYAQGQNFTFTMNMGSGIRYNITPQYAFWGGLNWMHISNLYLSQPQFANYGINVYGPMFGIDMRLGKLHRHSPE